MERAKDLIAFILITAIFSFSFVPDVRSQSVTELGDAFNNFSNASAYLLPAFVFGMTLVEKDKPGTVQFVESAGMAMGITFTLKYSLDTTRPNGEPHSFPSGHATITVVSAEFLYKRYGWKYGLPAYFVAAYVGYDRVRTNVHYPIDVLGGATIAFISAYTIAKPYKDWTVQPVTEKNELGVKVSRRF